MVVYLEERESVCVSRRSAGWGGVDDLQFLIAVYRGHWRELHSLLWSRYRG